MHESYTYHEGVNRIMTGRLPFCNLYLENKPLHVTPSLSCPWFHLGEAEKFRTKAEGVEGEGEDEDESVCLFPPHQHEA
jgi:hypothetical protein